MALGLLSTMIVARRFPADVFGTFVLLQVVVGFVGQFSSLGLDLSIARFIAATDDQVRRCDLMSTALWMRLSAIVVAGLVVLTIQNFLLTSFNVPQHSDLIPCMLLLLFWESFFSLLKSGLQGIFRFTRIGISELVTSTINVLLILTAVSLNKTDVIALIFARVIAVAAACTFAYISLPVGRSLVFKLGLARELLQFGFPLQLNDIIHVIDTQVDTLLVGALLMPTNIAVYAIARKIPDSLRQLYEPFRAVYFSFSSKLYADGDLKRAARLLNDSTRLIAFSAIVGTGLALLFGEEIVNLVFSAKYRDSAPVFGVLMFNLSVALIGNLLGTTLVTVGEVDKPVIVNLCNAVVSILAVALLSPMWGVMGAAIGATLGTVAVFPVMMIFLRKRIDATAASYLKPLGIFGIWAVLAIVLHPAGYVAKVGMLVLLLVLCVLLSVVTKNDLQVLLVGSGITSWKPLRRFFAESGLV